MDQLSAYAAELHAIATAVAKVPLGSRQPDAPYEALDEIRRDLYALASRMQMGAPARPANDRGEWTGPAVVITGYGQVIHASTRGPRR